MHFNSAPPASTGLVCDAAGTPLLLAHRTNELFDALDPSKTTDGGLHFGTLEQASMRAGKKSRLILAYLRAPKLRRSKDRGGNWKSIIDNAKRAGMDGIVYLNRYEGMTTEIIERLQASGDLQRLDGISDAQFKKLVPEAQDSYIVFSADQVLVQRGQ
ncbi:hypothetical protein R3Q56_006702 [Pseudomonas aeruginosa]|nr:hypothetical protein [Pseudomonas aeruginosa]ELR2942331.1 hypothetical protein [Pseudomonas aeruginosa]